jgi:hypothetical protein
MCWQRDASHELIQDYKAAAHEEFPITVQVDFGGGVFQKQGSTGLQSAIPNNH